MVCCDPLVVDLPPLQLPAEAVQLSGLPVVVQVKVVEFVGRVIEEGLAVRETEMEVAALTTTLVVDCVSDVPAFEHFMVYV